MAEKSYSIKFCALMMYIFNGEIIIDRASGPRPQHESLAQLLDRISFDGFDPPVGEKQLTWLKRCRLKLPTLTEEGIRTQGFLWEVLEVLPTNSWYHLSRTAGKRKYSELGSDSDLDTDEIYSECLDLLKRKLYNKGHTHLAQQLGSYLGGTAGSGDWWPVKEYKDLMAAEVLEAIRRGQHLYLAGLRGR